MDRRELSRAAECPKRMMGSCEAINGKLGWRHGCPIEDCDRCWKAGGFGSRDAEAIRVELETGYRNLALTHNGGGDGQIIEALLKWEGLSQEQRNKLLTQPDLDFLRTAKSKWDEVKESWGNAVSFIRAVASRGIDDKRVELTVKGARHVSCFGRDLEGRYVRDQCPSLRRGAFAYCGACGCGETELARLDGEGYTKLDYPTLKCPRKRNGFSNSEEGDPIYPPPRAIKFNMEIGGLGDNMYMLWIGEGLRNEGVDVSYWATRQPFRDLCLLAGHRLAEKVDGVWPTGPLPMYHHQFRVDLERTGRLELWGKSVPIPTVPQRPKVTVGENAKGWARSAKHNLTRNGTRFFATLYPLSYYTPRNWTRAHWVDLAYRLENVGVSTAVFVEAGQKEWVTSQAPSFPYWYWGQTVEGLLAMMEASDVVISVSSGPSVLAATLEVPTVVLMGPERRCYDGMGDNVSPLHVSPDRCGCVGCSFNGDNGFSNICDSGCRAMYAITPQDVLKQVYEALSRHEGNIPMSFQGRHVQQESVIHPHVPEEKAEFFTAVDSHSTESEYLELLSALIRVQKPQLVLETGAWTGSGTLTLGLALKRNGMGRLVSVEKDPIMAKKAAHKLDAYGVGGHVVVADESVAFIEKYDGPKFDFVFLDTELEHRAEELEALLKHDRLSEGALIAIHDTSKRRIRRGTGEPDDRTRVFYEGLAGIMPHWPLEKFDFPLSRGMLLLRYRGHV